MKDEAYDVSQRAVALYTAAQAYEQAAERLQRTIQTSPTRHGLSEASRAVGFAQSARRIASDAMGASAAVLSDLVMEKV